MTKDGNVINSTLTNFLYLIANYATHGLLNILIHMLVVVNSFIRQWIKLYHTLSKKVVSWKSKKSTKCMC